MGCKASSVRTESLSGSCVPEEQEKQRLSAASKTKGNAAKSKDQTSPDFNSVEPQQGRSGQLNPAASGQPKSSRSSMPTSPPRLSADSVRNSPLVEQPVTYAQDDDPFAPPPPLPPEVAAKSDSVLTVHAASSDSDKGDNGGERGRRCTRHPENHFDPIPMPEMANANNEKQARRDRSQPRLPSADSRTVRRDATGTFRTPISDHDKTDSAQAAKEYQQRMEAKRKAEEVHTKRRRLEEFDPVRPVDSFNVTHRGLLGRCWDRRAPELIPVSFIHTMAKMIGVEDSHTTSTTTTLSHTLGGGGEDFPPGSPIQQLARLREQSCLHRGIPNVAAGASPITSSSWTGISGRRVPRRSHWFSVGGVSTDGFAPVSVPSPTTAEPFYVSNAPSSPTTALPTAPVSATLVFPAPFMMGGGALMHGLLAHSILNPSATASGEQTKSNPKRSIDTSHAAVEAALTDAINNNTTIRTLTADQVMALPWETREKYYNLMIARNPRFMGIKDNFAFKLGAGVSNDSSVKFLRKRNLEPAPGVTAMRWNRVEFFHPSLHTLVRAVAKTQGMSIELSQVEYASVNAVEGRGRGGGMTTSTNGRNVSVLGFNANGCSRDGETADHGSTSAGGIAAEGMDSFSLDALHRSFSQYVMGHVENRSFARTGGGGGGGQNGSPITANNSMIGDKNSNVVNGVDKSPERHGLWSGGSLLLDLYNSIHAKDTEGKSSSTAPMRFPEDSVLALALAMPYSRLGLLAGVPPAVRDIALSNIGRVSGNLKHPLTMGLGSWKDSRDTANSTSGNAHSPMRSGGYTALRPNMGSVLVALNVSCFSVSINPFEWQERHYTRFPVDVDGSKRSSHNYGEGIVTDVMYGGLMVVECSSMEAVQQLQALLASMAWTEERSLHGIVKDVRKHLKAVRSNLHKSRVAAAKKIAETASNTTGGKSAAEEAAAKDWSMHRYRIVRRVGGRPMRDAVELEEISVFFVEDEEVREERTTLHQPTQNVKVASATSRGPAGAANGGNRRKNTTAPPSLGLDRFSKEARPIDPHTSPNSPDPDITSSFSRVASAWIGLPVISAVLRTWALHLLSCPEYAQPMAMYLQKHAGLAPVLQFTALGSFYHEGNTPSIDGTDASDPDYLFFECDGPAYHETHHTQGAMAHHPQPAPRIPTYNRFYASLHPSPSHDDHDSVARAARENDMREQRQASSAEFKPGNKDAPTAVSSPSHTMANEAALNEVLNTEQQQQTHSTADGTGHGRLRVRDPAHMDHHDGDDKHLGPKSHSDETMEAEGGAHLADSPNSPNSPPWRERESTAIMCFTDDVAGNTEGSKEGKEDEKEAELKTTIGKSSFTGSSSTLPKRAAATRNSSPHSPGRLTTLHSCRNDDRRKASPPSLSPSSSRSSSSFFDTTLDNDRPHGTFLYPPNSSSSSGSGGGSHTAHPSAANSQFEHKTMTATALNSKANARRPAALVKAAETDRTPRNTVPASMDGLFRSSRDTSVLSLSKLNSPQLFAPTPQLGDNNSTRDTCSFELVAMAKTVGPDESLAAQEAQRRANAGAESSLPHRTVNLSSSQQRRHSSGRASSTIESGAVTSTNAPSTAVVVTIKDSLTVTAEGNDKKKKKTTTRTKSKVMTRKSTVKQSAQPKKTTTKPNEKPSASATTMTTTIDAAYTAQLGVKKLPLLSVAMPPVKYDAKESQMQSLGTSAGAADRPRIPDTPSGVPGSASAFVSSSGGGAVVEVPAAPHVSEEEAEGLWYMTMLEVKAQRQELEDLRQARRNAEDHRQQRQDELRALNRIFLPCTHPQDLDCALLYLKTALFEPDDVPSGRLFLPQQDWLPLLAAVWTSPANRLRSVEIAAELTWMDIPRVGLISGLLYHHYAAPPLEKLIIRSDKLLGAAQHSHSRKSGNGTATTTTATTSGGGGLLARAGSRRAKKEKQNDSAKVSDTSLTFVTELDRVGSGFGPGCPPFFIAPEEARDTLWLLLCAVATNTTKANFHVVLKGILTPETAGAGGSSGSRSAENEHTTSGPFVSLFTTRRRDERGVEPLLLKPESLLLDSFVVQPTLCLEGDACSNAEDFSLKSPFSPTKITTGGSPVMRDFSRHAFDEAGPLIIVTDSLGNSASQGPFTTGEPPTSPPPNRHHKHIAPTASMTARSINGPSRSATSSKVVTTTVPTHQHHMKRRPWARDGIEVEERPFYQVLMHRCGPIEEARVAAANSADPSSLSAPYISHYHHPYNAIHNDARFYVSAERQQQLQAAVKRAVAIANGGVMSQEAGESIMVYSSKPLLPCAKDQPQQQQHKEQASSEFARASSASLPPLLCPPPLLFGESSMVFGLESAEEETKVLCYEEQQLRDHAADIWEALRKSVKHYNQAQHEAKHKAVKGGGKNASPLRLITLEY